ncbi:MAG: alpha/beta hydrolase [Anaerolineae bacterium]
MQLELLSREPETDSRPTPILFVHGAWHGAWCWAEHFLPYFAQHGYRAFALSLRGHGNSPAQKSLRLTRVADYVADVAEAASQLPAPPVLVGHSMGGLVTQKYLESHRAPAGVLLASVPVAGVLPTTLRILRRHPLAFLKANLTLSLYPIIGTPALAREAFFSAAMDDEQVARYFAQLGDESYPAFLDMLAFSLPRPQRVQTPLLVLGAAGDTIFYPAQIKATARAYHTTAHIFPGMAHDMMLEAGWQAVADHILAWLDQQPL